ncbi:MAG: hypothetical protein ABW107_04145, partial [Candidatus Thiodiazotropha sp. 6PLUC5]
DVEIDQATSTALEDKAVLFLVPKKLSGFMRVYLQKMDGVLIHPKCSDSRKPKEAKAFLLCEDKVSSNETVIRFLHVSGEKNALIFIKSDRWRLSRIDTELSEKTLNLLARWK